MVKTHTKKKLNRVFPTTHCSFYLLHIVIDFLLFKLNLHGHVSDRDSETSDVDIHCSVYYSVSLVISANL
jgi:hypothetical protein